MNLFRKPLHILVLVASITALFPIVVTILLNGRGSPGLLPLYLLLSIAQPIALIVSLILSVLIIHRSFNYLRKTPTLIYKLLGVFLIIISAIYLGYVGLINLKYADYYFKEDRYNKLLTKEYASDFILDCVVSQIYGTNDIIFLGTKSNLYSFLPVGYTPRVSRADVPALKELAESVSGQCGEVKFSVR